MIKWKKLGKVFCSSGNSEWMQTHASNPVARHIQDDLYRIYFSARDLNNKSSIAFVDIDIKDPLNILNISKDPVISFGDVGLFDDMGASMGCFANIKNETHLYYLGWNITKTAPWHNSIGVAKELQDGTFRKVSLAPIMDRSDADPYSLSYPWVVFDNDVYHMWYGSNLSWGIEQESMGHLIKYAYSKDGINWICDGKIALEFKDKSEYAMSKPCVVKDGDLWRMWYSYRGAAYKIGYAESKNGIEWERKDALAGITTSDSGWDSDTVEYPCVFNHKGTHYMLYNGNRYGQTGFGIAIEKKD